MQKANKPKRKQQLRLYRAEAQMGSAEGQYNLGIMHAGRLGFTVALDLAFECTEKPRFKDLRQDKKILVIFILLESG